MKIKHLLTKTLLVAAGLLLGGANSAWADWSTVYSNNYESASTFDENLTFSASGSGVEYKACQIEDGVNHYLKIRENTRNGGNGVLSLPDYSTYNQYEMSFKIGFYTSNSKSSSFQIRNGSTALATFGWGTWNDEGATISYTIGSTLQGETLTATKQAGGTRASDTYNSIVKWYTFTITGNSTDDKVKLTVNDGSSDIISNSVISNSYLTITSLYVSLGNAHAEIGLDDMQVRVYSDAEIVSSPTFDVAYAGANRTVTITPGVSSSSNAVTTYYTTDGSDPTSSSAVYSSPLDIAADCTVKAISISSTSVASAIVSQEVTVGKLKLVAPTLTKTAYSAGKYTVTMSSNQSGLAYPPASYTNYYSIDGGAAVAYSDPFELNEGSTVTGYVAATNYTNSDEVNLTSAARPTYYATSWTQDYTNITSASGNGAYGVVLNGSADFNVNGTDMKNIIGYTYNEATVPTSLNTNVGLSTSTNFFLRCNGGNSGILKNSGSGYLGIQNLKVGDVIVITTSGSFLSATYGVTLNEGMCTNTEYYFTATETEASIAVSAGTYNYIKDITVLSSTVPATISAAGWATLYTPYALDFSTLSTEIEAYTATLSSTTVTLNKVDDVPANTGVVLKKIGGTGSYDIPVIASSSTPKGDLTGNASADTPYDAGTNRYYLALNGESKAQFKKLTSGSIAAGKAFLQTAVDAPVLNVVFGDANMTGIADVRSKMEDVRSDIFDLQGRKVAQPQKGLYIVNGKKVVIK